LKLAAEPANLANIRQMLAALAPNAALVRRNLTSAYFDTPDLALQQAGSTLRVREEDGRLVQTLKTADPTGTNLLTRGEWEDVVAENRPDPQAPRSGSRLPEGVARELRVVFTTEVVRETIEIEPSPGTLIEAAIDIGEIRGAGDEPAEPISEIEIELKDGDPTALYDLALKLGEAAPLRIDTRSKSERGYALVAGRTRPVAVHAEAVALGPGMSVETVLQRVARSCLGHLLRNEPAALAGEPEGVHQMRVAMRRLRSLLSAVKKLLPEDQHRAIADQLAGLAAPLGPARNLDVFATELLQPALYSERFVEPGWNELSAAAERERDRARARVQEEISSPRRTEMLLRVLRWFEGCGWRAAHISEVPELSRPIGAIAPQLLERRRRKVRKRSRHFARLTPRERHRLRIAVKKLRYTVELLRSLYPECAAGGYVEALKPVQDGLGHANDVRVAYGLAIELCSKAENPEHIADAAGQLLELHERALLQGEPKLRKRLRRLNRAQPFWRAEARSPSAGPR
jgi:triphosphatase